VIGQRVNQGAARLLQMQLGGAGGSWGVSENSRMILAQVFCTLEQVHKYAGSLLLRQPSRSHAVAAMFVNLSMMRLCLVARHGCWLRATSRARDPLLIVWQRTCVYPRQTDLNTTWAALSCQDGACSSPYQSSVSLHRDARSSPRLIPGVRLLCSLRRRERSERRADRSSQLLVNWQQPDS